MEHDEDITIDFVAPATFSPPRPEPRDRTRVTVFALSIAIHLIAIAILAWCFRGSLLPRVTVQSGAGGDGIARGEDSPIYLADPVSALDEAAMPSSPQLAGESAATDFVAPRTTDSTIESFAGADSAPTNFSLTGSDEATGWVGPSLRSPTGAPANRPVYLASQASAAQSSQQGFGGDGGDGLAAGNPTPSAKNKPPRYPPEARRRGLQGTVLLDVEVQSTGHVGNVAIIESSGHELLDDAAIAAVKHWQFDLPSPVACRLRLPIEFVLRR